MSTIYENPYSSYSASGLNSGLDQLQSNLGSSPDPYSQTVNGAITLVRSFIGTTHYVANDFVQYLQDPLDFKLSEIIDIKDAEVKSGTATIASLTASKRAVLTLWNSFEIAAAYFGQQGYQQALVANKGLNTLNGPNGQGTPGEFPYGFVNQLILDIDSQIKMLGGNPEPVTPYVNSDSGTVSFSTASNYVVWIILAIAVILLLVLPRSAR